MIQCKIVLRIWGHTLIEYLGLFPIFLGLTVWIVPKSFQVSLLLSLLLLYIVGICIGKFIQNWLVIGTVISLLALVNALLVYNVSIIRSVVLVVLGACLLFRGLQYSRTDWKILLPIHMLWSFGITLYFFSYFIYRYTNMLEAYLPIITVSGIIYIIMLLYISNTDHLEQATFSEQAKTNINHVIRKQNRLYITVMLVFILLLTQFDVVKTMIILTIRTLFQAIYQFSRLFKSDPPIVEPTAQQAGEMFVISEEVKDPSIFAEIIEFVAMIAAIIVLLAAVIFILYKVSKNAQHLFQQLFAMIRHFIRIIGGRFIKNQDIQVYQDEKESLFDWDRWRKKVMKQTRLFIKKRLSNQKKWEVLSETDKVRYLYLQFIKKVHAQGYQVKKQETAHELLTRIENDAILTETTRLQLDHLYNQARYSEEGIIHFDLTDFQQLVNDK